MNYNNTFKLIMLIMRATKGDYTISTDQSLLQIDMIYTFLKDAYWSPNIPRAVVECGIENSMCFGVYDQDMQQVGFARVITDYATLVYLKDVFIIPELQGQGIGKWFMNHIRNHPKLRHVKRWMLRTSDAQEFYRKFGFDQVESPETLMTANHTVNKDLD